MENLKQLSANSIKRIYDIINETVDLNAIKVKVWINNAPTHVFEDVATGVVSEVRTRRIRGDTPYSKGSSIEAIVANEIINDITNIIDNFGGKYNDLDVYSYNFYSTVCNDVRFQDIIVQDCYIRRSIVTNCGDVA